MGLLHPKARTEYSSTMRGGESHAHIVARLIASGYVVLEPVGAVALRYDLVIEDAEGKFWRIQCKTGRYINGSVQFHTNNTGGKKVVKSYQGAVDYFAVYSPDLGKIYLVPITAVRDVGASLRVSPDRGKQSPSRIRWAADYEL